MTANAITPRLRRHRRPLLALAAVLLFAALLLASGLLFSASLTVNTTSDTVDGDTSSISKLIANPGEDGKISLREAVTAANNTSGTDTITLPAGTYTLTRGEIAISGSLIINGAASATTIISGNSSSRVFNTASTLTLTNMTLKNAKASTGNGGAILKKTSSLTLTNVVFDSNTAPNGAGGAVAGTGGTYTWSNVVAKNNSAGSGNGGALYTTAGTLKLTGNTYTSNTAPNGVGGAVWFTGTAATITLGTFTSNSAAGGNGGAVYLVPSGSSSISSTSFTSNTANNGKGGGAYLAGAGVWAVSDTSFSGNAGNTGGGGLAIAGTGSVTSSLARVTLDSNSAQNGSGGGLQLSPTVSGATTTLTNVTLYGNTANSGGGAAVTQGTLNLVNVTVAGNTGVNGAGGLLQTGGTLKTLNTLVAANGATNCAGSISTQGYNLDSGNTCSFSALTDRRNAVAGLGAFGANGGNTKTVPIDATSNAIDAGTSTGAPATDQRGLSRLQLTDIGAYEYGGGSTGASISGTVFEDVNYGGGVGRNLATAVAAGGSARAGARIELYDSNGNLARTSTSASDGSYTFTFLPAGTFTVRVVSGSVSSARSGWYGALRPVQTYRTNASTGSAVAVTDHVGGETPSKADADAGGTTLADLTSTTTQAQSVTTVVLGTLNVTGVDFGYSFNVVVNANDIGQGSLSQFIDNANALANAGLALAGRTAGIDHAVFMLPDGTARAGMNTSYATAFSGGVATFNLSDGLIVTDPVVVDGQTQPGWTANPILELNGAAVGAGTGTPGFDVSGGGTTLRGLIINQFDGGGILLDGGGNTVQGCWIGLAKTGTSASANNNVGLQVNGGSGDTIGGVGTSTGNVISGNAGGGIIVLGSTTLIQGNRIGTNVAGTAKVANGSDGIQLNGAVGVTIGGTSAAARNLISGNDNVANLADGIWIVGGSSNVVYGNYIGTDVTGTAALGNYHGGVTIYGSSNNTIGGTGSGEANLIARNTGVGVLVSVSNGSATGNRISGNSLQNNGGLGIDLGEDGLSANNGSVSAALPNNGQDFPVITAAALVSGTLTVNGYVGSAAGQSTFAGARVEVFVADTTSAGNGEGQTYLGFVTADASGNFSSTIAVASGITTGTTRITATATDSSGNTSEFGANVVVTSGATISGTVFEDVNYGGGAGRNKATALAAGGSGRLAARVELSSISGTTATVIAVATTDAAGAYSFTGLPAASYSLRVVSSTVTSARSGYASTLVAVSTYRADGSTGTAADVTNEVGGGAPSVTTSYNVLANVGTQRSTAAAYAEATSTVTLSTSNVTGIDFGYNFDTVTHTNDSGPGSLRGVITNANTLGGDASLAQAGRTAGIENLIFMISNGSAAAGLRSSNNYFSAGVATLAPASALPEVTGLVIDAQTQPGWTAAPIVELNGVGAGAGVSGLTARGGSTLRGLVINRYAASGVQFLDAGSNVLQGCYIGTNAAGTAASANASQGVNVFNSPNNTIGGTTTSAGNLVSGNTGNGLNITGTSSGTLVQGNVIGLNAAGTARVANGSIGIYANAALTVGGTSTAARNVVAGNTFENIQLGASAGGSTVQGNYIGSDASGGATITNGSDGIWVNGSSGSSIGGSAAGAGNVIAGNNGRGVTVSGAVTGNAVLGNRIFGNANIGIDLAKDGLTANTGAKTAGQPNLKMNYPVFTGATLTGTTLVVTGYVGSAAGQSAFASARVEVFISDASNPNGQGKTYLGFLTSDASGNFSGSITGVSGVTNGTSNLTATATDGSGNSSEFGPNVTVGLTLAGAVFEDPNYGGGAGRSLAAAAGSGLAGATVELYDASGTYVSATTTGSSGGYTFASLAGNTAYFVRVVNSSVRSARSGSVASLLPVMTYRSEATAGTVTAVTNEVGGLNPAAGDAVAGSSGSSLWTACATEGGTCSFTGTRTVRYGGDNGSTNGAVYLTATGGTACNNTVFGDPLVGTAKTCYLLNAEVQSLSTLRLASASLSGVDFGFNFDTVANTNDSGAGSLRSVITNANTLGGDSSLVQSGRTAGVENLVFMISNGTAAAGLRSSLNYVATSAGSYNVATIAVASQLPTISSTLVMDAQTQPGWSVYPVVQLSGNGAASVHGLNVTSTGFVVRGLIVSGFSGGNGINLNTGSGSATVQGCWLGVNAAGTTAAANSIGINSSTAGNLIGGTSAATRNVASGNASYGIYVSGATNTITGNYVGTNAAGSAALPNGSNGLQVVGTSAVVGGTASGAGNLISGNGAGGLGLSATANGTVVQGNVVGLAADGATALPNTNSALVLMCSTGCTIGGTSAAARNIFSATTSGHGINLQGSGSVIQGNYIGTDATGTLARGASGHGIYVNSGASNHTIGGTAAGAGNLIRSAGGRGVAIDTGSTGIAVLGNRIYGNASIGIDLNIDGATANDGAKTAGAANLLMDTPVFTSASLAGTTLTVAGYVGNAAGQATFAAARVEVFISDGSNPGGQGSSYLGFLTADASGNFSGSLTGVTGVTNGSTKLTATATDSANNTSEFGPNVIPGMTVTGTVFDDVNYGGGAGRSLASSGGVAVSGATVELYSSAGAYITSTTTASGGYSFGSLAAGNYFVRVVSSTVLSTRSGSSSALSGVLTYRTNASTGTPVAVTDWVGGTNPALVDPGAGAAGASFNTSTYVFSAGLSGTAQAVAPVTVGSGALSGVDFGFNFDTVVNTNDSGAGSLRQALTNAEALGGDAALAVAGRTAAIEHVIFMIPNGSAAAGLRSSNTAFVGGVATLAPASALPTLASPIVIDAQLQPGWTATPVIELNGAGAGASANGLTLNGAGSIVRGLVINRYAQNGITTATGTGLVIEGNYLGLNSAGTAASANALNGILIAGGSATIGGLTATTRNVISGNTQNGVSITGGSATVRGNFIGSNAANSAVVANGASGVLIASSNSTVGGTAAGAGNVIRGNGTKGVAIANGAYTGNAVLGNAVYGNSSLGIDLKADGLTATNDGAKTAGTSNLSMDSPVFTSASLSGVTLTVSGYVGSAAGQSTFATARVEIFVADASSSAGQGQTYLGALTTDASGNFSGTLAGVAGMSNGSTKLTATATDTGNNTSEFGAYAVVGLTVSGTVFEDANYGGGAGRSLATSGGTGVGGVTLELYDNSGVYITSTSSASGGGYSFTGLAPGTYHLRVVSSSVLSQRSGSTAGLLPVLTFRTTATTGAAVAVTDNVGGTNPAFADPGAASAGATFSTSTYAYSSGLSGTAHAVAPVTLSTASIAAVDFGFNFDTVTHTNTSGAGSLRQVITNANALGGDSSLAQAGRTAAIENVVFMIPNGSAGAGLRSSFNYFTGGVATISVTAALPTVSAPLVIDAQTQPGWAANPVLELNGVGAGSSDGIVLAAAGSTVRGWVINRFGGSGVRANVSATVQGNWLGTSATGNAASANGAHGIEIAGGTVTLGGTGSNQANVISGNSGAGLWISGGGGHLIQGNLIGVGADGNTRVGNAGFYGIEAYGSGGNTIGGAATGAGNVISGQTGGSKGGIWLCSSNNTLQGNFIGTNAAGSVAVPNNAYGVMVCNSTTGNVIGGTAAAARNLISGNGSHGISATGPVTIQGNRIGTNAAGTAAIANAGNGIDITVAVATGSVQVGGTASGAGNLISGNAGRGVAVQSGSSGNAILGNRIYGNGNIAIDLSGNGVSANDGAKTAGAANLLMDSPVFTSARATGSQLVVAGYVGSAAGQAAFASSRVEIYASDNDASGYGGGTTYLGALTTDSSGNFSGTLTMPVTALAIASKLTGTATDAANNTSEFGANFSGLIVDLVVNDPGDAADASAGDGYCATAAGVCTLRAAIAELNAWPALATPPTIAFALPGCSSVGAAACSITPTTALPSVGRSVLIDGSTQTGYSAGSPIVEISGAAAPAGTSGLVVAASNSTLRGLSVARFPANGITLSGTGNTLVGLRIGLATATAATAANGGAGVVITGTGNTLGGATTADRNVIAGNTGAGVTVGASNTTLTGNLIGTDASGNGALGNGGSGVAVLSASLTGVVVSGNTIANNGGSGVGVAAGGAAQVQIVANAMSGNGGLGIDLGQDGVTANTGVSNASKPNNGINYPVVTGAGVGNNTVTLYGYIGTGTGQAAFAGARVEFFKVAADGSGYGEGQLYLGFLTADSNGRYTGTVSYPAGSLAIGDAVTATATDAAGNTSEFGPNWTATSVAALTPGSFNAFDPDAPASALTGVIRSKTAGSPASFAVIALDNTGSALHPGFTGTVSLTWVDARDDSGALSGSCRASWVSKGSAGTATFSNSSRVTVALTPPASGTRVMRLKLSYTSASGTITACSNDAYAALPASLSWTGASDADSLSAGTVRSLSNTSASGGVVHRAGRPFTVRAQALDATGALMTGYDGSPVLAAAGCLLPSGCTAATLTAPSVAALAGAYIHNAVSYAEVGALQLQLTDANYADIDAADTASSVRTLTSSLLAVGRFIPDSLSVAVTTNGQLATANSACLASGAGATFIGQAFGWAVAPQVTVTALNAAGATTTRWTGSLMKLSAGAGLAEVLTASGTASASFSASYGSLAVSDLGGGQARVTASSTDRFLLDLASGSVQDSVTPTWAWSLTLSDTSEAAVAGNPTLTATATQGSVAFNSGGIFHSGRLSLSPGYGDVRSGVHLLAQLQRYTAAGWVTMTEDQGCVTIQNQNVAVETPTGVFATLGACVAPMTGSVTTRGGRAWLTFPGTPAGAPGRLTLRLAGPAAIGTSCTATGASAALVPLAPNWLLGGTAATGPQALATWGKPQRDALLRRETW